MNSDYICTSKCEIPNNYVVETKNDNENDINLNECLSKCPSTKIYMRENSNKEYVCSDTPCNQDNEFYYNHYLRENLHISHIFSKNEFSN